MQSPKKIKHIFILILAIGAVIFVVMYGKMFYQKISAFAQTPSKDFLSETINTLENFNMNHRDPKDFIFKNWANKTKGLVQFRGNPTHTFYGTGPISDTMAVLWRFPDTPMCGTSTVNRQTTSWCGTGWTGQPVLWEHPNGVTEVIFGAYDKAVHFVNAATGKRLRPDFQTGDIIKGSVSLDPDGYPLLYFGSRDNKFRILSLNDNEEAKEIWSIDASDVAPILWNNDWDGNASIVDDILYIGGENSWMFAIQLNRSFHADGTVAVDPKILMQFPLWTDKLLEDIGDKMVSIENSPAFYDNRVYIANGGGRVVGFDVSDIKNKSIRVVFDYWLGDDIDASIVIDQDGMLYVSSEIDRDISKTIDIGQVTKLDPYSDKPLIWSIAVDENISPNKQRGIYATPALYKEHLYVQTTGGTFMAIDTKDGKITWSETLPEHSWSSPLVIDEKLIVATCKGKINFYDLHEPAQPKFFKEIPITENCIESTPAAWNGVMYVGTRDGYFYAIGPDTPNEAN